MSVRVVVTILTGSIGALVELTENWSDCGNVLASSGATVEGDATLVVVDGSLIDSKLDLLLVSLSEDSELTLGAEVEATSLEPDVTLVAGSISFLAAEIVVVCADSSFVLFTSGVSVFTSWGALEGGTSDSLVSPVETAGTELEGSIMGL